MGVCERKDEEWSRLRSEQHDRLRGCMANQKSRLGQGPCQAGETDGHGGNQWERLAAGGTLDGASSVRKVMCPGRGMQRSFSVT